MPDDEDWRPPDDRRPDDTAELNLNLDDDTDDSGGDAENDLGPLRELRRRDAAAPDEAGAVGGRRSTFRRHPARWLGSLAALVSLGAVAVGIGWTWWHSTIRIQSGSPGPTGSGSPGPTPSGGGTGPVVTGTHGAGSGSGSTVQSGCDSGCSPVDDSCNKACDDSANSCLNSTCNDTSCNDSSCNDSSCNDSSCNDSSCGSGPGSGAAHLAGLAGRLGEWVLALGHLPAGTPLLFRARRRVSVPARLAVRLIRYYQRRASGRLGVSCRYTPSCSRYGLAAIERYGLLDGARLAADRIHRCVPAVPHGTSDPLPGH